MCPKQVNILAKITLEQKSKHAKLYCNHKTGKTRTGIDLTLLRTFLKHYLTLKYIACTAFKS